MKKSTLVAMLATVSCVAAAGMGYAAIEKIKVVPFAEIYYPPGTPIQNAPEIPFTVDPTFFKLPPAAKYGENIDWGEVAAVTDNAQGHVFVLNRNNVRGNLYGSQATEVLEFDQNGNYVREIGHNAYGFSYGHGIRTDKNGDIWVVDKGTNMVTKFDHVTGKLQMVLGRRNEGSSKYWQQGRPAPGAPEREPEDGAFEEPTDVAWDSQGNIYISDGYGHSRVAKFDKDGTPIGSWGHKGSGHGEFSTVHNIQIDKNDNVWVADRSNGRIQIFDTEGNFKQEIIIRVPTKPWIPSLGHEGPPAGDKMPAGPGLLARPGTPDALCYNAKDNAMYVGDVYPGRVYKLDLTGKVLGYFGHVGKKVGDPGPLHGLACGTSNVIYTAEFVNNRVERFVINPAGAKVTGN